MTRKETQKYMLPWGETDSGKKAMRRDVDKIYDDIEAQSCQNCQHHDERDNYCNLLKVYGLKYCSKFEEE